MIIPSFGQPATILDIPPDSELNLGTVAGPVDFSLFLDLINIGSVPLNLIGPPGAEVDVAEFVNCTPSVTTLPATPILAGIDNDFQTTKILIDVPDSAPFSFRIVIPTDDPVYPVYTFTVVGNGAGSTPTLWPDILPPLMGAPSLRVIAWMGTSGGMWPPLSDPENPPATLRWGKFNAGEPIVLNTRFSNYGFGLTLDLIADPTFEIRNPVNCTPAFTVPLPASGTTVYRPVLGMNPALIDITIGLQVLADGPFSFSVWSESFVGVGPPPQEDELFFVGTGLGGGGGGGGATIHGLPATSLNRVRVLLRDLGGLGRGDVATGRSKGGPAALARQESLVLEKLQELCRYLGPIATTGDPNGSRRGFFGQRVIDTVNLVLYICGSYPSGTGWIQLSAGAAGGAAVNAPAVVPTDSAKIISTLGALPPFGDKDLSRQGGGGSGRLSQANRLLGQLVIAMNDRYAPLRVAGDPTALGTQGAYGQLCFDTVGESWYINTSPTATVWAAL